MAAAEDQAAFTEEEAYALDLVGQASGLLEEADRLLILRDLRPEAEQAVEALRVATLDREAAEQALAGPVAVADQLTAELADAKQELAAVASPPDGAPLRERHAARRDRAAWEEEVTAIEGRLREHNGEVLAPVQQALVKAREREDNCTVDALLLAAALTEPLRHPRARPTKGYRVRMARVWGVVLATGDRSHPDWPAAVEQLKAAMGAAGITPAEVQPKKRDVLPSGQTVVTANGRPPVIIDGVTLAGSS
jgi:hypothetical protein